MTSVCFDGSFPW